MIWTNCNQSDTMPGIYPKDIPHSHNIHSSYFNYWDQLKNNYQEITTINDAKWAEFFKIYPIDRQRGKGLVSMAGFNRVSNWKKNNINSNNEVSQLGQQRVRARANAPSTREYEYGLETNQLDR